MQISQKVIYSYRIFWCDFNGRQRTGLFLKQTKHKPRRLTQKQLTLLVYVESEMFSHGRLVLKRAT